MATANFTLAPGAGWTLVAATPVCFIKIRSNTPKHAIFVTSATSLPAATVVGYKVNCEDHFCVNVQGSTADNYYVRTAESQPGQTRIDVFYLVGPPKAPA